MDLEELSGCSTKKNVLGLSSDNKNLLTDKHMHKHCQPRRKNIKENKDRIQNQVSCLLQVRPQWASTSLQIIYSSRMLFLHHSPVTRELLSLQEFTSLRGLREFFYMCSLLDNQVHHLIILRPSLQFLRLRTSQLIKRMGTCVALIILLMSLESVGG